MSLQSEDTFIKCQNLFFGKNKKNISKCCLLKFLPRVLSVVAKCGHCERIDQIICL